MLLQQSLGCMIDVEHDSRRQETRDDAANMKQEVWDDVLKDSVTGLFAELLVSIGKYLQF